MTSVIAICPKDFYLDEDDKLFITSIFLLSYDQRYSPGRAALLEYRRFIIGTYAFVKEGIQYFLYDRLIK